jgi:molybdenum cofactor biosynthesis protein B
VSHHREEFASITARLAVLTVSDTRTTESDESGALILELLASGGHESCDYRVEPDDPDRVRRCVEDWLGEEDCDGALVNGGTGISRRDSTYEALNGLLEKRLDGFGELFRALSYREIGSAAMLSRAGGGIASGGKILFFMPGSPKAVRLAMEKLVLPEIGHLLGELRKDRD